MYKTMCLLAVLIAAFSIGFWCVKFYVALEEGGLKPAGKDFLIAMTLVVMLAQDGKNLRDLTLGARDAMNGFNVTLNRVIDAEVNLRSATSVLSSFDTLISFTDGQVRACQSITELQRFEACMTQNGSIAQAVNLGISKIWPDTTNDGAKWQKEIQDWKDYTANYTKNRFDLSKLETLKSGNMANKILDIKNIHNFEDSAALRGVILSFKGSFLYIIEVMMLVTALVGPVFLSLILFPGGTRPLMTWGVSFLTLGFCKICFSLFSGLSSLAMVYSGPENVDMLVAAIVLGLLAPVLSFTVASGAGIGALTSISSSGQGLGINTGVSLYYPGTSGGSNNPGENENPRKRT